MSDIDGRCTVCGAFSAHHSTDFLCGACARWAHEDDSDSEWTAALAVVPELVHDGTLMFMSEDRIEGQPIWSYKHCDTRRYIHLDRSGQAWNIEYIDERYTGQRISLVDALARLRAEDVLFS
jgi:hypothetical protein